MVTNTALEDMEQPENNTSVRKLQNEQSEAGSGIRQGADGRGHRNGYVHGDLE